MNCNEVPLITHKSVNYLFLKTIAKTYIRKKMKKYVETNKFKLTALIDTALKSQKERYSHELHENEKKTLKKGESFFAYLERDDGDYAVIAAAKIEGKALKSHIKYAYRPHWNIQKCASAPSARAERRLSARFKRYSHS